MTIISRTTIAVFLLMCIGSSFALAIELDRIGELHLHPVDIKVPENIKPPKDFPLNSGDTLTCNTCHSVEGLKETPLEEINKEAADFLRGGPYSNITEFCYRCHQKKDYKARNIHKMFDDKGLLNKELCATCHKETPDPEKVRDIRDVKFRLPPEKLCIGCHLKTPHLNALNHQQKPTEKMKKVMEQTKREKGIILPLDSKGRIMCVTCHAPHERGVVKTDRPASKQVADADVEEGVVYKKSRWSKVFRADKRERLEDLAGDTGKKFLLDYLEIQKEVLLRLPAKDGSLCLACHNFER